MAENGNIIPINIEDEMKGAYIDYSMSVIISRALPDVRDGLKPVHRRILFGMDELGVNYNKSYKKSARIVGEVLGKFHPHGDTAVYDSMVRMAQPWSLRYPLVDGQGNYGSIDGDSPAAMRYTEARLMRIAEELLADLKKDTVDWQPNFDDSLQEPQVLPSKIPNLLLNGTSGIAVGMATNMAPHNLTEVVNGIVAYIDDREITVEGLMEHIKAPDFPTGATIYGYQGVKNAFETGRGRIVLRAHAEIEFNENSRDRIIVSDVPFMVNKANMLEKTAELINEKKIEGIAEMRDESDKDGLRVVYELKRDANPNVVLNMLYKHTQLQTSFSVNNVALVKGRPETLNLKDLIVHYVDHRHEVVIRRAQYDLKEAQKRAHILEGYLIALDNIEEVIRIIRASKDTEVAREELMANFTLSEIQARAILDMRLARLTGLERDKIEKEYAELMELIDRLNAILSDEVLRMQIIKDELIEVRDRYGDARRTDIVYSADDMSMEDLIDDEEMVITISNEGYAKRTSLSEYRVQSRGGRGSRGVKTKEEDFTKHLLVASQHKYLLIFTNFGKVYWKKVYELPEGSKTSKGRPVQNIINIENGEFIQAIIPVSTLSDDDYINNHFLVMATEQGIVKKTTLEAYSRPRTNGINAITVRDGDQLLDVRLTNGNCDIILGKRSGKVIRFHESKIRPMGRTAAGVKGVTLESDKDVVVGLVCVDDPNANLLVVSEKGYGKRSDLEDYRITGRGGKGVKTINVTEKTGQLVSIKHVSDIDELMIINKSGIVIRIEVRNLRVMGRATQGVRLINLGDSDEISSVAKVEIIEEDVPENVEGEISDETTNDNVEDSSKETDTDSAE